MSRGWRGLYTIRRAVKASELPRPTLVSRKGTVAAMKLKAVVCPSESPGGWKDANAECSECGKEVYCIPLCSEVPMKLCVKCAGLLFT